MTRSRRRYFFQSSLWLISGLIIGGFLGYSTAYGTTGGALTTKKSCDRPALTYDTVLIKVNEARLEAGLPPLLILRKANEYADLRAHEIEDTNNITHVTKYGDFFAWQKSYVSPSERIETKTAGELLTRHNPTPCAVVAGFLASPTHRAILLDSKKDSLGVGVVASTVVLTVLDTGE